MNYHLLVDRFCYYFLRKPLYKVVEFVTPIRYYEPSGEEIDIIIPAIEKDLETPVMRNVINNLVEKHSGICGIFTGEDENGYNFIIGSKQVDCKNLAAILKEKLNARGGGSNVMIQGSVMASQEEISQVLLSL